jgi:hypothetical protein
MYAFCYSLMKNKCGSVTSFCLLILVFFILKIFRFAHFFSRSTLWTQENLDSKCSLRKHRKKCEFWDTKDMNKSSVVPGYHRGNPFLLQTLFKMEISAKNEVQVSSMYLSHSLHHKLPYHGQIFS